MVLAEQARQHNTRPASVAHLGIGAVWTPPFALSRVCLCFVSYACPCPCPYTISGNLWQRLFVALQTEPDDEWHSVDSAINRTIAPWYARPTPPKRRFDELTISRRPACRRAFRLQESFDLRPLML
jgi:hypothetical protein